MQQFQASRCLVGVDFVRYEKRLRIGQADVILVQVRFAAEAGFRGIEPIDHILILLNPVVAREINQQQRQVRSANQSLMKRFENVGGDRWSIDQLHHDIFPGHHAGERFTRREWIFRDFGRSARQRSQ